MSHPAPESLIPHALGADDPELARHLLVCPTCREDVDRLRQSADALRGQRALARAIESAECLDELAIADFVDGRLTAEARAPVVAHLLTCARCRLAIVGTSRAIVAAAPERVIATRWRRWSLPLGAAAAAVLLLLLWPRGGADHGGLREPPLTGTLTPTPIAPRDAVARVEQLVWTSVPRAEQYRVRIFDAQGSVLWTIETSDTTVALPDSVGLSVGIHYFWRVEAQTDYRRAAASDLVEFEVIGSARP